MSSLLHVVSRVLIDLYSQDHLQEKINRFKNRNQYFVKLLAIATNTNTYIVKGAAIYKNHVFFHEISLKMETVYLLSALKEKENERSIPKNNQIDNESLYYFG